METRVIDLPNGRCLILNYDDEKEHLTVVQEGEGWKGFKDWPEQSGTGVSVSFDLREAS